MKPPVQKIVRCHKCGYMVFSRDAYLRRNLNKRPVFCGNCGSRDFIEILAKGYHLVICRRAEDIEQAVKVLGNVEGIPDSFLEAFEDEK